MIRLLVALWLVRRLDGLLADDRTAGRWHGAWALLGLWTAVGALCEAVYHGWGWHRHRVAAAGGPTAPCRH